jgi:hypothetical protein
LCIWMDCEVAVLQRTDDMECHFVKSNGYQMVPIMCISNPCPNNRPARCLATQKWERWISDWDWLGTRVQLLNNPLTLSYNLFSFHGSLQDYKIDMDMKIAIFT